MIFSIFFTGLLIILALIVGFIWSNNIVKRSVAFQGRQPVKTLLALIVNVPLGLFFIYYYYSSEKLFYRFVYLI